MNAPYEHPSQPGLDLEAARRLVQGRHGDPFALLGPHEEEGGMVVRTFAPGALAVSVLSGEDAQGLPGRRVDDCDGLFEVALDPKKVAGRPDAYCLHIDWPAGESTDPATPAAHLTQLTEDPYAFGPLLGELDLHLIAEGNHRELGRCLGAHVMTIHGIRGVRFAVWAPNATRVSVVGDFNQWDGRRHPMRHRVEAGVWELFVPRLAAGSRYKYELLGPMGEMLPLKADPVALETECPPATASVVSPPRSFRWTDEAWLAGRPERHEQHAPMSIYEVHAGSWLRVMEEGARSLDWEELAERLIPYARGLGFTHLEFLPIMEHPFGGSWGYQPLGQFAPSARFGTPEGFAGFVDRCHAAGLGVILDWVPAHFPTDAHGLARFDGTALYEHADPKEGFHQDWNTLIYNLGRNEVVGFLIASALEWIEHFHVDGLRVDAVASMLYRDYSREPGEWVPNVHGGRENLESVAFVKKLNTTLAERCPGVMVIAEESTAWPGVSASVEEGGLGFSHKWNMGWMHDTLRYMQHDPVHRRHHHHDMSFGLIYAFSERFVLPISHDEVVHGKGSLLGKMPGDEWQRLANLRAYLGFMWAHPGKKLLFMGCEFGETREWNHDASPQWDLLDDPRHRGVQRLVRDLNRLYIAELALHVKDSRADGFAWLIGDDAAQSVFGFARFGDPGTSPIVALFNFTPVVREGYRVGLPAAGRWREVLNSDAGIYGGSNTGNGGGVGTEPVAWHGQEQSAVVTLPPLAAVFLRLEV
jgi:1,4-alpha-glucan branching enzyme